MNRSGILEISQMSGMRRVILFEQRMAVSDLGSVIPITSMGGKRGRSSEEPFGFVEK